MPPCALSDSVDSSCAHSLADGATSCSICALVMKRPYSLLAGVADGPEAPLQLVSVAAFQHHGKLELLVRLGCLQLCPALWHVSARVPVAQTVAASGEDTPAAEGERAAGSARRVASGSVLVSDEKAYQCTRWTVRARSGCALKRPCRFSAAPTSTATASTRAVRRIMLRIMREASSQEDGEGAERESEGWRMEQL